VSYRDGLTKCKTRRAKGAILDRDELDQRFADLSGADFGDAEVFEFFRDVFDSVCAPEHTTFSPDRDECVLDTENKIIRMKGLVVSQSGAEIATIFRTLSFRADVAAHNGLIVRPEFRGVGLAAILTLHSLDFYLQAGLDEIRLTAALTFGLYYWAKLGFDFATPAASTATQNWFARVNNKLDLGLDCREERSALRWALLGREEGVSCSLEQIADAFPDRRARLTRRADDINIALDDQIHAGKAILLGGDNWDARMEVSESAQRNLRIYVDSMAERAKKALQGP
jgi:hypothetical protein